MKKITSLLIIALMALNSCSPVATTKIQKSYTALKKNAPILVYMSGDELPSNPENIGDIKIGDSGFTTECSFDQVIEKAKVKAREVGGNAIQIYDVKRPDLMSTCYRIKAKILKIKIERETELSEEKLKEVWGENGINNIEGIYENVVETSTSPKYKLACKKQDDDNYTLVYLNGAKGDFSQLWKEGDIKAKLYKTASQIFKVDWFMANKSIEKNWILL